MWLELENGRGEVVVRYPDVSPPAHGSQVYHNGSVYRVAGLPDLHFVEGREHLEAVYRVTILPLTGDRNRGLTITPSSNVPKDQCGGCQS